MKLHEEIRTPNGLSIEVWDGSRVIAADTASVVIVVRIPVEVKDTYFDDASSYQKTVKVFGSPILFEYRNERTFVPIEERQSLFMAMLESFKKDVLPYLSREQFPKRFVLSKYEETLKNPWKFPSGS